jgi:adenosylmethionine-8-amino-7-oxononanoate aminotransferase
VSSVPAASSVPVAGSDAGASSDAGALLRADRDHLWHPYTSASGPTPVHLVHDASGVRLTIDEATLDGAAWGEDGRLGAPNPSGRRAVIDAMSSWWSAIHGYQHPVLDRALVSQLGDMAHVMFGGLTHRPAIELGERLSSLVGLPHVFLADSGSVAVEVALKMARQYQTGLGRTGRTRVAALRGGYHGDTLGAMSVCDPDGGMHAMYADALPPQVFLPRPPAGFHRDAEDPEVQAWRGDVERLVAQHAHELAAIIAEPVLQGAGGMFVYSPACLLVLRETADRHGLLLILDEIATGFGRTGQLFAGSAVTADIVCLGKALTGGYLTLGATACSSNVAEGIASSPAGVLMHGPTFMGNPLACRVALANLDLLATGAWRGQVSRIESELRDGLGEAASLPGVEEVRVHGAVGVIDMGRAVDLPLATAAALAEGVWIRPFRSLIYTMPPYVCTTEDIQTITRAMVSAARACDDAP